MKMGPFLKYQCRPEQRVAPFGPVSFIAQEKAFAGSPQAAG
jgi:hypothetical protein